MKSFLRLSFLLIALFLRCCFTAIAQDVPAQVKLAPQLNSDELSFKENKNQWHPAVKFLGEIPGGNIFLEQQGFTYLVSDGDELKHTHPATEEHKMLHGHVYKVDFLGSDPAATFIRKGKSEAYYNYFIGSDSKRWASDVHSYKEILYQGLYPKTDMRVYGSGHSLKYDLILHPQADASVIQFRYRGATDLFIRNENLIIETSVGKVVEVKPYAYQLIGGNKKQIPCLYQLKNNILSFTFPSGYDTAKELVIDPQMVFATYTGSYADNFGYTATYDEEGNMYLGGYVNAFIFNADSGKYVASEIYPFTPGAFQTTFQGGTGFQNGTGNGSGYASDMGITKLNPTGTSLVYSTYLGGYDNETPHSLFVNTAGQLCIYGRTYSPNFPVTPNAFDTTYSGSGEISVTVLSADGKSLIGSTFIGGTGPDGVNFNPTEPIGGKLKVNYGDDARGEIICDKQNNIYVASCTSSPDFPVTGTAFQKNLKTIAPADSVTKNQDGCVFKLNTDCSSLIYSTYIGGSEADAAYSLELKSDNTVYVAGGTMSLDFPSSNNGIHPSFIGGSMDGFLVHLNTNGSQILHSTFIGTTNSDQTYFVKLDNAENVYVVGNTYGGIYPVTPGVYSNPGSGQYITKFSPELNTIAYSTVFGNGNSKANISPTAFLVDTCENVYVSGWGGTVFSAWPHFIHDMTNMPVTSDAFQSTTDGTDFYVIVFSRDAESLLYGTYFGGNGAAEHVDGGTSRFDKNGIIYEAVCASCGKLGKQYPITDGGTPTTPGVWSNINRSENCNELGFKMEISLFRVFANAEAPVIKSCTRENVKMINRSLNATNYHWDFGTGNPADTSDAFEPVFTFPAEGTYHIRLIVTNPLACINTDTAYATVRIINKKISAGISTTTTDYCDSVKVAFKGNNNPPGSSFHWNFNDGNFSDQQNISHTFFTTGSYHVVLTVTDTSACNELDTAKATVIVNPHTSAKTADSLKGCIPFEAFFPNISTDAASYSWDFGTGNPADTSNEFQPHFIFNDSGSYLVRLIAFNTDGCRTSDTAYVLVHAGNTSIVANIQTTENEFCDSTVVAFTGISNRDNTTYLWNFNDGSFSNDQNVTHTFHSPGNYNVTLTVNDHTACVEEDTASKKIFVKTKTVAAVATDSTTGCIPLEVTFGNESQNVTEYLWNFGTGNPNDKSTLPAPAFTYTNSGTYKVMLIALNPGSCNLADTAYAAVVVKDTSVTASLTETTQQTCDSLVVKFKGTTSSTHAKYLWNFSDGKTSTQQNPSHTFTGGASYSAALTVTDTSGCNARGRASWNISVTPKVTAAIPNNFSGCLPLQVNFQNQSSFATKYFWSFGTGKKADTSNLSQPSFTYSDTGAYSVMMIASNPGSCNGSDTAYSLVKVKNTSVSASLNKIVDDKCDSVVVVFSGSSNGSSVQYLWDFNDGSFSSNKNPKHTFHAPGTYKVKLLVTDNSVCNKYDSVFAQITVQEQVSAEITTPDFSGCAPVTITFNSEVTNAANISWNFGDGNSSTEPVPTHTYTDAGNYKVILAGVNPALCNYSDSSFSKVVVYPAKPDAGFSFSPDTVRFGEPVTFTNQTNGAENYLWDFGDGTSSNDFNANHIYQYSGIYRVCLEANYIYPCPDSTCVLLRVDAPVVIDVPNAFTPNGDGRNDILYVRGQHYKEILFKVFNRWGEKVFETNDLKIGWDGTYKGKPQEMDVFAWELFATMDDNSRVSRSGNVTLLR